MFVLTAKLSKTKLIAAIAVLAAAVIALILLLGGGGGDSAAETSAPKAGSNDERVAFLATFGWSVNAEPTQAQRVTIPADESDEVFARYNKLQKSQGYDLSAYAGKEVMRYVYEVLNYPDATDPVYATVLVYDKHVIGGDVTCSAKGAPMHGFEMPS